MIHLTRINRSSFVLNSDLIEHIEATPDTLISLTTGQKLIVQESADEVIQRVIRFRRQILCGVNRCSVNMGVAAQVESASGNENN